MTERRREHKLVKYLLFLGLVVAAGVVCYLVWDGYFKDTKNETSQGESASKSEELLNKDEKSESEATKTEVVETITTENPEETRKVPQYEGEDINESADLTGTITYIGETSGIVSVWVNIDQYLTLGTCNLKVIQNNETAYEETVALIADVTTSTCDGFNFARDKLNGGNGEVIIELKSGDKKGVLKGNLNL